MVLCAAVLLRHFKACFAHWPDLKNLIQLFANFHHQSVLKAPGATLNFFWVKTFMGRFGALMTMVFGTIMRTPIDAPCVQHKVQA